LSVWPIPLWKLPRFVCMCMNNVTLCTSGSYTSDYTKKKHCSWVKRRYGVST
jgi:hypothetical protein